MAIVSVFGSALAGNSRERPDLAEAVIPLEACVPVVPSREGVALIRDLCERLGYTVETDGDLLDDRFPDWGPSPYFGVRLASTTRLRELLAHQYVLLPVLDDDKHYWIGDDEVNKMLRFGDGWLESHPLRELISHRYLKHQRSLVHQALAQLLGAGLDDLGATAGGAAPTDGGQAELGTQEGHMRNGVTLAVIAMVTVLAACSEPTPTPTAAPTATPTPQPTATATPTPELKPSEELLALLTAMEAGIEGVPTAEQMKCLYDETDFVEQMTVAYAVDYPPVTVFEAIEEAYAHCGVNR